MDTKPFTGEEVAKKAIWLAYQASVPMGMGFLQVRDDMTEQSVWDAIYREGGHLYVDYCFGRMMKTNIDYTASEVKGDDRASPSYQSWATCYQSYDELFKAAIKELTKS